MNLIAETLGLPTIVFGWIVLVVSIVMAVKTAPWHKVQGDREAQNVWLGMSLVVFLVWQFSAQIDDGISFHFLLMTMMTLMFGWQFALMGAVLVLIGISFYVPTGWQAIGINGVLMALIPIGVSHIFLKLGQRYLEPNFFVYVFFNGFLAAGVAAVLALVSGGGVLLLNEVYSLAALKQIYFPFIPLMAIPEGFVNGMLMAALIVLKPEWISTFHDSTYLNGK